MIQVNNDNVMILANYRDIHGKLATYKCNIMD